MIKRFFSEEDGAVTVDWTVLTAAIVGLGLTSAAAVRTGTGSLADNVRAALTGATIDTWAMVSPIVSQNFANGDFSGWSTARAQVFGAWGNMLGPFGNETQNNPLTYSVNLPAGMSDALVTFDLIIADSWDGVAGPSNPWTSALGDSMRLMVDGQIISTEHFVFRENHPGYVNGMWQERTATATVGGSTFNLTMTPKDQPTTNVGGAGWVDQRWSVRLEAVDAPQNFQLGFSATSNQSTIQNANTTVHDESFGIQNFNIKAR
ncbi:MAG: Flp family type IVb pilin [Roseinatronobacter sp.]